MPLSFSPGSASTSQVRDVVNVAIESSNVAQQTLTQLQSLSASIVPGAQTRLSVPEQFSTLLSVSDVVATFVYGTRLS